MCYQCVFHQTEANLATIQLQNHQNVKKNQFWQKVPGVNGLMTYSIWFFHVKCWSIIHVVPKNLLSSTLCKSLPLSWRCNCLLNRFLWDLKMMNFDFLISRVNWFTVGHSCTPISQVLTSDSSSFKSLREQNKFMSSANKMADNLLVELFRSLI